MAKNNLFKMLMAGALLLAGSLEVSHIRAQNQAGAKPLATPTDYLRWRGELKNWGRWGANDEKGTSNLITPSKIASAAKLVKSGIVVSLARPVPQAVDPEVPDRKSTRLNSSHT